MALRRAQRSKKKLKILMAGPAGSGKTFSSLLLAHQLTQNWETVGILDTENGSADLYSHLGPYACEIMKPPFDPSRYVKAVQLFQKEGIECMILDSISHAWDGEGGILDIQQKYGGRFQDWQKTNTHYQAFVQAILQSDMHMICTVRKKQDHVIEEVNGKKVVRKVGLKEVQREGLEYEFDVAFDIQMNHYALASKDRTGVFDGDVPFKIDELVGMKLKTWSEGEQVVEAAPFEEQQTQKETQ